MEANSISIKKLAKSLSNQEQLVVKPGNDSGSRQVPTVIAEPLSCFGLNAQATAIAPGF